jgi:hypothetical protein
VGQSLSTVQALPSKLQKPSAQNCEQNLGWQMGLGQQSLSATQPLPSGEQAGALQTPFAQVSPEQQSPFAEQAAPVGWHVGVVQLQTGVVPLAHAHVAVP